MVKGTARNSMPIVIGVYRFQKKYMVKKNSHQKEKLKNFFFFLSFSSFRRESSEILCAAVFSWLAFPGATLPLCTRDGWQLVLLLEREEAVAAPTAHEEQLNNSIEEMSGPSSD
jgi:hypothetical protein